MVGQVRGAERPRQRQRCFVPGVQRDRKKAPLRSRPEKREVSEKWWRVKGLVLRVKGDHC